MTLNRYTILMLCLLCWPFSVLADDPCEDIRQRVDRLVKAMPSLSDYQLTHGKFGIKDLSARQLDLGGKPGSYKIHYSVNGSQIFEYEWAIKCGDFLGFCDFVDTLSSTKEFGGIYVGMETRHVSELSCSHLVLPSLEIKGFKVQLRDSIGPIVIRDLDNDKVSEIIKWEIPQWTFDCNLCEVCRDNITLPNIYHLTSLDGDLTLVNKQFPAFYDEQKKYILGQYSLFKSEGKNYSNIYLNSCSIDYLDSKFKETLLSLESFAKESENINSPVDSNLTNTSSQCIGKMFTVQKGGVNCDFLLNSKGLLHYKNKKVSEPIVYEHSSDGAVILADFLLMYPSSPSGRYFYIKGCRHLSNGDECWLQWLFDSNLNKFQSISIGRYGAHPEIYWNSDDRFAALFYSDEGRDQINILDAETGKIWVFPDWGNHDSNVLDIDKKSFAWIDSHSPRVRLVVVSNF